MGGNSYEFNFNFSQSLPIVPVLIGNGKTKTAFKCRGLIDTGGPRSCLHDETAAKLALDVFDTNGIMEGRYGSNAINKTAADLLFDMNSQKFFLDRGHRFNVLDFNNCLFDAVLALPFLSLMRKFSIQGDSFKCEWVQNNKKSKPLKMDDIMMEMGVSIENGEIKNTMIFPDTGASHSFFPFHMLQDAKVWGETPMNTPSGKHTIPWCETSLRLHKNNTSHVFENVQICVCPDDQPPAIGIDIIRKLKEFVIEDGKCELGFAD